MKANFWTATDPGDELLSNLTIVPGNTQLQMVSIYVFLLHISNPRSHEIDVWNFVIAMEFVRNENSIIFEPSVRL